ncbi:MAG: sensor histidine kinase [Lachnospiraceae bacterium]|nr:sensor histidine kinase [Lachnospiraceae bacterium]
MKRVIDTLILFIASSFIVDKLSGFTETVIVILLSLVATSILFWIDNNNVDKMTKKEKLIICTVLAAVLIMWVVHPSFMLFAPILVYSAFYYNKPVFALASLLLFARTDLFEFNYLCMIFLLVGIAIAMSYSTRRMMVLEEDIKKLRDASVESSIRLKERNRQLLINQNNEIHLATLKERNRIAREIHDNVGHMLTRSILQVGALATIYTEEPLHSHITGINDTLNVAMNNIRESVHDIHDESVDFEQALKECTKQVKERYNLKIDYDMNKYIPKDVKYSFIAIVKEAMANIIKHSNGTDVLVVAREHPGFYQLVIEDNGTNAESKKKDDEHGNDGIGLLNMKERVDNLGGRMHINTEDGFRIFISVPKKQEGQCE